MARSRLLRGPKLQPKHDGLTNRELHVLAALHRGASYEQVARRLGVSINTVRTHVRSMYAKLGARTKTEAVVLGLELGLIQSRP